MNDNIKDLIKEAGLHQYQVADLCGISETTLVRWLRYELSPEKKEKILSAIRKGCDNDGILQKMSILRSQS